MASRSKRWAARVVWYLAWAVISAFVAFFAVIGLFAVAIAAHAVWTDPPASRELVIAVGVVAGFVAGAFGTGVAMDWAQGVRDADV